MFRFYKTNLLKISFGRGDVKEFRIKGAAYIVIKYIITENAHASKKRTAHTNMETGSQRYPIKRSTYKGVQHLIMVLQNPRFISQFQILSMIETS